MDEWELCPDIPYPNQVVELRWLSTETCEPVTRYYTTIKKAEYVAREVRGMHKGVDIRMRVYHMPGLRALKGTNPESIVAYYLNGQGRRKLKRDQFFEATDRAIRNYYDSLERNTGSPSPYPPPDFHQAEENSAKDYSGGR